MKLKMQRGAQAVLAFCILHGSFYAASAQTLESTEARFLAGLRERRLFELAESYCREQLAEAYTARRHRVELTTELARTLLESALFTKPPARDERFAAATAVLDGFRFEGNDDPWRTPIAVQRGITDLVWGELLREEAQTLNAPEAAWEPSRNRLQAAIAQLRKARGEIEKQLQAASRPGAPSQKLDEPTPAEWQALKRNVDYQLARAYRNQAESYPPRSADRTAALDLALETLTLPARSETTDALTWQARLDEVVCRRLLGDLDGAERMLTLIDEQKPPPEIADRVRAQRIRVCLDAGLPDQAEQFVREADADPTATVDPDARLAVLEWMIASSRTAAKNGRTEEANRRRELAGGMTRLIAERHSAYWARRAESLLAAAVAQSPGGDAALLVRAAESMYQQGNVDRALELYDQALAKAQAAQQIEVAVSAAFTAAAIEQQRGHYAAAEDRFLRLAATFPDHSRADEAHLAGIFNTAQKLTTLKDATEQQNGVAEYAKLLQDHLSRWPRGATTSQAGLWLGRLRKMQRDWKGAIAAFAQVSPGDPQAIEAVPEIRDCYVLTLLKLPAAEHPTRLREAETVLGRFVPRKNGTADIASPVVRSATLAWAQLALQFGEGNFEPLARTLAELAAAAELPEPETKAIETLRVLTDVLTGKLNDAVLRIGKLTSVASDEAAIVADRLHEWQSKQPAAIQAQAAPIALRLLELRRAQDQAFPPTIAEAQLLAAAGRTTEARRVWDALIAKYPRDGKVHEAFAEFLAAQPAAASQAAAIGQWRTVERLVPESSPSWYRARLGLARAYLKQGDKSRAAQLLELTTALHPDWGGETLKAEFQKLSAEIAGR